MRIERHGDVALAVLEGGKANAMGPAWIERLSSLLDEVDASRPSALVVTGYGKYYSAGLDLPVLLTLDRPAMGRFINAFSRAMTRLFALPFPVVAAVNGHAVAGGCVLALQADVRLMAAGEGVIGLKEARIGIGLPAVVVETARCQLPAASLVPIALEARLLSPPEALRLGLVDEVVAPEELLPRALARAGELAAIAPAAYAQIKTALRRPALDAIACASDAAPWLETWFSKDGQARILEVVRQLAVK